MLYEKTEYYNSNAPRVNGVSFAQEQTEAELLNALWIQHNALQASADDITGICDRDERWYLEQAILANFGNMSLGMTA